MWLNTNMNLHKYLVPIYIALLLLICNPQTVQAQYQYVPGTATQRVVDFQEPKDFIGVAVNILLGITISVSVLAIMFSGIKLASSKGDPRKMQEAKEYLGNSIKALLLALLAITLEYVIRTSIGATGKNVGFGL